MGAIYIHFLISFLILALIVGYYYYQRSQIPKINAAFVGTWQTDPKDLHSIKLSKTNTPVLITIASSGKVSIKIDGESLEGTPTIISSTPTELVLRYEEDVTTMSTWHTHYKINKDGDIEVTRTLADKSPNSIVTIFKEYFLKLHRVNK